MTSATIRTILLGCVSAVSLVTLGACSGSHEFAAGRGAVLGALAQEDDGGTGSSSSPANGSGSGSAPAAGSTTTTTTTTTTAAGGGDTPTGTPAGPGRKPGGVILEPSSGGGGTLARIGDTVANTGGGLIAVAGNALLGGANTLGPVLTQTGWALQDGGLEGLPVVGGTVDAVTRATDGALNGGAKVVLLNQPVVGSGAANSTQLAGISALSARQTQGQVATVGLLSSGQTSAAPTQLASLSLGGANVLGGSGPALIGASVLSPTQTQGVLATAGVLSGASSPAAGGLLPVGAVTGLVGGVVGGLTGGGSGAGSILPTGSLGLGAGGAAGGGASLGGLTAVGGVAGGLGVILTGR